MTRQHAAALVAACLALAAPARASYFRMRPLEKVQAGLFQKIGTPQGDGVRVGLLSPFIWHDHRDGHLLLPGVDWQLLNVGVTSDTELHRGSLMLGPGIALEEPLKGLLRRGLEYLPGSNDDGAWGLLRAALAPCQKDQSCGYLTAGPMWGLSPSPGYEVWDVSRLRGSLQLGVGGAARFGK